MWFIGVEVEQETSAPPPKKNPGSAPGVGIGYVPVPNNGYGFYEGLTPNRVSFLPLLALCSQLILR